jgi:hypothetical protein
VTPHQTPKRLPAALERHRAGGRLRDAFDKVNMLGDGTRTYERTALTRWLSGESTPQDRDFIAKLAQELGDPEIVVAHNTDLAAGEREINDLMTRFRNLGADRKALVLRQLIAGLFRSDSSSRLAFNMRVEVNPELTAGCHRLDVAMSWVGRLPPRASVEVAADEEVLKHAYEKEGSVFRELVPLGREEFGEAMEQLRASPPTLRYKASDSATFATAERDDVEASPEGFYSFANPEVRCAEVRLDVCLPYPADLPMYPVILGAYAVAGRAMITIATDGRVCGRPHVLQFLGHTPTWVHRSDFHRSELSVEIGDDASIVEPNSGVVFYWRVGSASR